MKVYECLDDLFRCARPILYEIEYSEETWYICSGTCFVILFMDCLYVITAKHCVSGNDLNTIAILKKMGSREFLPFNHVFYFKYQNESIDVAILEVDMNICKKEDVDYQDFLYQDKYILKSQFPVLAFRGFPTDFRDYEYGKITHKALLGNAKIDGESRFVDNCKKVRFLGLESVPLESIDGLSGSPMYGYNSINGKFCYYFEGMLIRGNRESQIGHIIKGDVLSDLLLKIYEEREQRTNERYGYYSVESITF